MSEFLYYSKITKKPYESLEALQEAEAAVKKAEEERLAREKLKEEKANEIKAELMALPEQEEAIRKKIEEFNKEYGPLRLNLENKRPSQLKFPPFPFSLFM